MMTSARLDHTATLLPNGKVLVSGGKGSSLAPIASSELYDPATGLWTATGSMTVARRFHTATLLPNGKVLVNGGTDGGASIAHLLASSELYDPATGLWTATGSMTIERQHHTATLLPNGMVLASGSIGNGLLESSELYNPATGLWTATGSMIAARASHAATLLPNGQVLVSGGIRTGAAGNPGSELYNPATGLWVATGSMTTGRYSHTATLLLSGKVLVNAGDAGGIGGVRLASSELYDPATGLWVTTGSMAVARDGHTTTPLPNGKVLVSGGVGSSSHLASSELYDPATGLWGAAVPLFNDRGLHAATLLPNGKVLLSGGELVGDFFLNDSELY